MFRSYVLLLVVMAVVFVQAEVVYPHGMQNAVNPQHFRHFDEVCPRHRVLLPLISSV